MKTYTAAELAEVIEKHGKWLRGEFGGDQADLGGANLGGADLRGADLREANLGGADLRWADLRGADLGGADLREANLGGADLREANLGGADLRWAKNQIYIGQRSDGYQFFAKHDKNKSAWIISAGCRYFTPDKYREHTKSYNCETKRAETLALIDFAETMIRIKGVVE